MTEFKCSPSNKLNVLHAALSLILACYAIGCATASDSEVPTEYALPEISLYLSRADSQRASFEQFKIAHGLIFAECGRVAGGRQFAQLQNVAPLSDSDKEYIAADAWRVAHFQSQHGLNLDDPGKSDSFFDPGQFLLSLRDSNGSSEVKTSLDSVASPAKSSTMLLQKLAVRIREIAARSSPTASLCGNASFFDLGGTRRAS